MAVQGLGFGFIDQIRKAIDQLRKQIGIGQFLTVSGARAYRSPVRRTPTFRRSPVSARRVTATVRPTSRPATSARVGVPGEKYDFSYQSKRVGVPGERYDFSY